MKTDILKANTPRAHRDFTKKIHRLLTLDEAELQQLAFLFARLGGRPALSRLGLARAHFVRVLFKDQRVALRVYQACNFLLAAVTDPKTRNTPEDIAEDIAHAAKLSIYEQGRLLRFLHCLRTSAAAKDERFKSSIASVTHAAVEGADRLAPLSEQTGSRNISQRKPNEGELERITASADVPGSSSGAVRWKADLFDYPEQEIRTVTFATDHELEKALRLFWHSGELYGVPRDIVGGRTVALPVQAIQYLTGIRYTSNEILSMNELTPEERRDLQLHPQDDLV